jgi:hypothetical protein
MLQGSPYNQQTLPPYKQVAREVLHFNTSHSEYNNNNNNNNNNNKR